LNDGVLEKLNKGHTCADFIRAVEIFRQAVLVLSPTFVAFTPWITLEGYCEFLRMIVQLGLVEHVAPIQLAIRLLIPSQSRLLELHEIRDNVLPFDQELLVYPWTHADPRVDELCHSVQALVARGLKNGNTRWGIFEGVWDLAHRQAG